MKKLVKILFAATITIFLTGDCFCKNKIKTITIKRRNAKTTLYFSGIINPYKKFAVISPVAGVITEKFFEFGQNIDKGDRLFVIKSTQQQTDYQDAMITFLKAKQSLRDNETKYKNDEKLWKDDLISTEEYTSSKNTYLLDRLAYVQAKSKLLTVTGGNGRLKDIDKLTLDNIDDVSSKLELRKKSKNVFIIAPTHGIALIDEDKKVGIGSDVKVDQVLLYLGLKDKLATNIKISEINVNQLHAGQEAIITGDAFPETKLKGYIKSLASQASTTEGQPAFSAQIVIPRLTKKQATEIKMGMSVKAAIPVIKKSQIIIPIDAINADDQTVQVLDPITKKINTVRIETSETTLDGIIVTSGLKEGDQVVVPNSN